MKAPIPWPMVPLGEVVETQYGLNSPVHADGIVPIVGMQHVQSGTLVLDNLPRVTIEHEEVTKFSLRPGDLLFNRTNSAAQVGKTAIVGQLGDGPVVFASYLVRMIVDPARALPAFVNYAMNTPESLRRLRSLATPGVSQFNINPTVLCEKFVLPLPSLEEQAVIVEILSHFDAARRGMSELLRRTSRRKVGLMQELLTGQRRFVADSARAEWRQTRVGPIPADWMYPTLADIADEVVERAGPNSNVEVLSCSKYDGLVDSLLYFGKRVFSKNRANYKVVRRNHFAFPANHIEEGSIGLLTHRDVGIVSPIYVVFKVYDSALPEYLYAVFKTATYRHIFATATNASVDRRGSLRWRDFARLHVPLPPIPEQRQIVALLRAVDRETELLKRSHDLRDAQRQAVTDKFLSGELRVLLGSAAEAVPA